MDAGYVLWPIGQSWGRTVERAQHQLLLNPLFLGVPVKARYGLAKRPPRRGRWRPSHRVKRPDCLRRLAPQPRFVAAHAVKQGQVKVGKALETLDDGAGIRPERWANGPGQQFLVGGGRSVRAGGFAIAIDLSGGWEHAQLTGSVGRGLPGCQQKFALDLKQARFDRAGTTKSPQQACESMNERKLDHCSRMDTAHQGPLERSIDANIFQIPNNGLSSKAVTPTTA